jgi:hypothetical protein
MPPINTATTNPFIFNNSSYSLATSLPLEPTGDNTTETTCPDGTPSYLTYPAIAANPAVFCDGLRPDLILLASSLTVFSPSLSLVRYILLTSGGCEDQVGA